MTAERIDYVTGEVVTAEQLEQPVQGLKAPRMVPERRRSVSADLHPVSSLPHPPGEG